MIVIQKGLRTMQETVWNNRIDDIKKSIEGLQGLFNARGECIQRLSKQVEELESCKGNLLIELQKESESKAADLKNHQARDMALVDELAKKNEEIKRLKTEIEEYKAKRDFWQDLANEECKKKEENEKLVEAVQSAYDECTENMVQVDDTLKLAMLAGAFAIRSLKNYKSGAYCNIKANGVIDWVVAERWLICTALRLSPEDYDVIHEGD